MTINKKDLERILESSMLKYENEDDLKNDIKYINEFHKNFLSLIKKFDLNKVKVSNLPFDIEGSFLENKKEVKINLEKITDNIKDNNITVDKVINEK